MIYHKHKIYFLNNVMDGLDICP